MINNANIQLRNGRSVNFDFLILIRGIVTDRISVLLPNMKYTLAKICGEAFWENIDNGERRTAGHCMVHLVTMEELPFRIAESKHEYPVYYQLK